MTDAELTDRLFLEHPPETADLVLVFASASDAESRERVRHGAALHLRGLAPWILLTGGGAPTRAEPEARSMAREAIAAGVPETCLLVEDASTNTMENAHLSRALLESRGLLAGLRCVLLVSSPWHVRRAMACATVALPAGVRLRACPSPSACGRSTWTLSAACRRAVEQEIAILDAWESAGIIPRLVSD